MQTSSATVQDVHSKTIDNDTIEDLVFWLEVYADEENWHIRNKHDYRPRAYDFGRSARAALHVLRRKGLIS